MYTVQFYKYINDSFEGTETDVTEQITGMDYETFSKICKVSNINTDNFETSSFFKQSSRRADISILLTGLPNNSDILNYLYYPYDNNLPNWAKDIDYVLYYSDGTSEGYDDGDMIPKSLWIEEGSQPENSDMIFTDISQIACKIKFENNIIYTGLIDKNVSKIVSDKLEISCVDSLWLLNQISEIYFLKEDPNITLLNREYVSNPPEGGIEEHSNDCKILSLDYSFVSLSETFNNDIQLNMNINTGDLSIFPFSIIYTNGWRYTDTEFGIYGLNVATNTPEIDGFASGADPLSWDVESDISGYYNSPLYYPFGLRGIPIPPISNFRTSIINSDDMHFVNYGILIKYKDNPDNFFYEAKITIWRRVYRAGNSGQYQNPQVMTTEKILENFYVSDTIYGDYTEAVEYFTKFVIDQTCSETITNDLTSFVTPEYYQTYDYGNYCFSGYITALGLIKSNNKISTIMKYRVYSQIAETIYNNDLFPLCSLNSWTEETYEEQLSGVAMFSYYDQSKFSIVNYASSIIDGIKAFLFLNNLAMISDNNLNLDVIDRMKFNEPAVGETLYAIKRTFTRISTQKIDSIVKEISNLFARSTVEEFIQLNRFIREIANMYLQNKYQTKIEATIVFLNNNNNLSPNQLDYTIEKGTIRNINIENLFGVRNTLKVYILGKSITKDGLQEISGYIL